MARRAALLAVLLALLTLAPVAVRADPAMPDPAQPTAAVAVVTGNTATLAWLPGTAPVDGFSIYGITNGTLSPLTTAAPNDDTAQVPLGFSGYAVTAWHAGTETNATRAILTFTDPCLEVYPGIPPDVAVNNCLAGRARVMVELYD